ncbi:MAG: (Fe-S)-binding protein [Pyramidobacter sp.]|nr:(Fe-S)-binding protein [Pyramidobacter sp.]
MFSETAYKNADACRFCWMCRHLCPVALKTGKELNSARAKGLMVSLVKRGAKYDSSMAEAMWECCLCGACTNDCATGYEPRSYIREARSLAVSEGIAPKNVMTVVDKIFATGNIYGAEDLNTVFAEETAALPKSADVLLYMGEVVRAETPEIGKAAMSLLKKAGVEFTVLADEPVSGGYMGDMIGFVDEVRRQALKVSCAIDGCGARTIVVLDPIDARIIKHEYAEWNCAPRAEVLTATAYFASLVAEGKLQPAKNDVVCSIHDTGALCRDLDESAPVRALVEALGMKNVEMFRNRALAKSCGGALLRQYAPELSALTVEGRWEDLLRTDARLLVTEAPGSYAALKSGMPKNCQIEDIFVLLDKAL